MPKWDDNSKYRLLLAVIAVLNPSPPNWNEVAEKMGAEFSAEAVRQQYQKIKKNIGEEQGETAGASATGAAATPRPRTTKAATNTPKSSSKKPKKGHKLEDENDDCEDELAKTPSKRAKTEHKLPTLNKIKVEKCEESEESEQSAKDEFDMLV